MKTRTRYRRVLALLFLLAVLVRAPALIAPPLLDDHVQASMSAGEYPARRAPWDLYAFARDSAADRSRLRAEGTLPWWSAPDYQLVMVRPLSSLLLAFDHNVLRHWGFARVHSLAWMLALLSATAAMLRRRFGDHVALLATAIIAVDDALTSPLAWHANRCAAIAVTLGVLAVDEACRALDERSTARLAGATLFAAAACLGGEYAWTVLPAVAIYAQTHRRGPRGVWFGMIALGIGYLVGRRWLGGGVRGCVLYPDVTRDLGLLLFLAPGWWSAMLADFFAGVGVEVRAPIFGLSSSRAFVAATGGALCALRWQRTSTGDRAPLRWLFGAGMASLVVVSTAWLSARLMLGAAVWSASLVAMLILRGGDDRASRVVALGLLLLHLPFKAVETWRGAAAHRRAAQSSWSGAPSLLPEISAATTVYVLNATDPEEVYFGRYTMRERGSVVPRGWHVLASTGAPVHVFRESRRTLSIVHRLTLLEGVSARFFRSGIRWPTTGATYRVGEATLRVIDGDGLSVRRVQIEFDRELNDSLTMVVASTARGLRRAALPEVGGSIMLSPPRAPPIPR